MATVAAEMEMETTIPDSRKKTDTLKTICNNLPQKELGVASSVVHAVIVLISTVIKNSIASKIKLLTGSKDLAQKF
jgi:hypothetical protein